MPLALGYEQVCARVEQRHGGRVLLRRKDFIGRVGPGEYSTFRCHLGHKWQAPAHRVMNGHGCPECRNSTVSKKLRLSIEQYRSELPDSIEVLSDDYKNRFSLLPHRCKTCSNEWEAWPRYTKDSVCPLCALKRKALTGGYSHAAIEWLDLIARRTRLRIDHVENGGEFKVASPMNRRRYSLDGYNRHYHVAFEFFGDYWHGRENPSGDRYEKTLARLNHLLSQGFGVAYVWDTDFKRGEIGRLVSPYRNNIRVIADRTGMTYSRSKGLLSL